MYPEIEHVLTQCGYQKISLNVVGVSLSVKQRGEYALVVVTVDEMTGQIFSREQFVHISETFREFLKKRGCYHSVFLYLLLSEDDSSAGRLFEPYENYWRIIPTRRQLLVYETSGQEFEDVRVRLEQSFPGTGSYGGAWGDARTSGMQEGMRPSYRDRRTSFAPMGTGSMPWVNLTLILCNVLIFFLTDWFLFADDRVAEWGALNWYLVLKEGEWYRIVTSMFLHDGIQHVFNNMLVLFYIGSCVEQQMGGLRYGILYFVSGILAGCTSMVYNMSLNENVYSIGASGAVFGVMGALLFLVVFRRRYTGGYNARQMIVMVVLSLYGGFASHGVDNAAHIGGFAAGFLLAFFITAFEKRKSGEFGGNR